MVLVFRRKNLLLFGLEALLTVVAVVIGMLVRPYMVPGSESIGLSEFAFKGSLYTAILLLSIFLNDLHLIHLLVNKRVMLPRLARTILLALLLYAVISAVAPDVTQGRVVFIFSTIATSVGIVLLYELMGKYIEHPRFQERVLVLGDGRLAQKLRRELALGYYRQTLVDDIEVVSRVMEALFQVGSGDASAERKLEQCSAHFDLAVLAFENHVWPDQFTSGENPLPEKTIASSEGGQVIRMAAQPSGRGRRLPFIQVRRTHERSGELIFNYPSEPILRGLAKMKMMGVRTLRGLDYFEELTGRVYLGPPADPLFFTKAQFDIDRLSFAAKAGGERLIAAVIFVCVTPLLLLVPLAILLDDGRPLLFVQKRVGRGGRIYRLFKWRSMDDAGNVTRVGRWIRKTKLDEFPQLINVLKGEMALVGPRPELPVFVKEYEQWNAYYCLRHMVRPGLTGWAQVMFPDAKKDDALTKVAYDLYYVKYFSLVSDMVIMAETVKMILFGGFAHLARLAGHDPKGQDTGEFDAATPSSPAGEVDVQEATAQAEVRDVDPAGDLGDVRSAEGNQVAINGRRGAAVGAKNSDAQVPTSDPAVAWILEKGAERALLPSRRRMAQGEPSDGLGESDMAVSAAEQAIAVPSPVGERPAAESARESSVAVASPGTPAVKRTDEPRTSDLPDVAMASPGTPAAKRTDEPRTCDLPEGGLEETLNGKRYSRKRSRSATTRTGERGINGRAGSRPPTENQAPAGASPSVLPPIASASSEARDPREPKDRTEGQGLSSSTQVPLNGKERRKIHAEWSQR